jgi:hypothetical protein
MSMRSVDVLFALINFISYVSPPWKQIRLIISVVLCILFSPFIGDAFDDDIEKDLQHRLEQSRTIIVTIQNKLFSGASLSSEITRLKAAAENIRINNLLLGERFAMREEKIRSLGSAVLARHQTMTEGYRKALTEYLSLIDSLPPDADAELATQATQQLIDLLNRILPKKKRPIIGSLPYKHLNYPAREPISSPSITPVYRGGNKTVSPDDTKNAAEALISAEIAALAQSLNWNPVSIYEYVKNNVDTEWYWGCMKGAVDTLHQKSGNDCDQATLLTALLRASGFPTRYVRGTVQFFPDIERAKNLTGIDDPARIAEFIQKAGIPYKPVIASGKIANIQIERIWVESQIPYANYRGALIDDNGKTWLGLDTGIKVKGYSYNDPPDVLSVMSFSTIRDEYLGLLSTSTASTPFELNQTPLEYLQSAINSKLRTLNSHLTYIDFLRTKTLIPEVLNIVPASMQFNLIKATNEYAAIPDDLIHKVKLTATNSSGSELFAVTMPVYKVSNQQVAIGYEPETVQDQEIVDSFGGLDNTPSYLVHLRPVLTINKDRIVVAKDGLLMGSEYNLTIELISPNSTEKITNALIAGNLSVICICAQKAAITPLLLAEEAGGKGGKDAERLLYEASQRYFERWNQAENELASLLHLSIARPLPMVVTMGGVIDVFYLLDMPHGFTWKGVFIDAGIKAIETEDGTQSAVVKQKLFMQLSSLQGSILENRIFEDDFQVDSISTAKLFQFVTSQPGSQLITVDKTNIDGLPPTVAFDDDIREDISNSVNQSFTVRIPQSGITYHDWTGIGYIKENPETGESAWMLSGMIAGGMTAIIRDQWIAQDIAGVLSLPNTRPSNPNPGAAVRLVRMSDYQIGFTGEVVKVPCQVRAEDSAGEPVQNVPVVFKIITGGGKLQGVDKLGNVVPNDANNTTTATSEYIVKTGTDGIARVKVTLGEKTDDSPLYRQEVGITNQTYWELVGLNMVAMTAPGGSGSLTTDKPFEAYARAGAAAKIEVVSPKTAYYGLPNTLASSAWIKVVDRYGNSISGKNVNFFVERTFLGQDPGVDAKTAKLYTTQAACPGIPIVDCPNAAEYTSTNPLVKVAEHFGAMAYVIVGNTANTRFTVKATAKKDTFNANGKRIDTETPLPAAEMVYQTHAKAGAAPESALSALAVYQYDEAGNRTDAGKAGSFFPENLDVTLLYHEEGYGPAIDVNGNYYLKGTGVFTTSKVNNGQVKFTPNQGGGSVNPEVQTTAIDGQYSTNLTLGASPALNVIQAVGSASVTVPAIETTSGSISTSTKTLEAQTGFTIWGVKPIVLPSRLLMMNSDGYPVSDMEIRFTIEPTNYSYSTKSLYLDFYEKNTLQNESWMGFMQADPSGKIILTRGGMKFNPEYTYMVQLIADRGTKKEVVSERVTLPVAQLKVLTDESAPKLTDEIKFSDGSNNSNGTKKYHIAVQSKSWISSCETLTGRIVTLSTATATAGQPVMTPQNAGNAYSSEYSLAFNHPTLPLGNNLCNVQIVDTLDGGSRKDKFILSNRPRSDLESSNISNTAIIYGGIGNKLWLEVAGVGKELSIEPVGVVVLGIDGLRQDVLYAQNEQQVNDPHVVDSSGSYYVQPSKLKGLCAVLGGKYNDGLLGIGYSCDDQGMQNKHIKLQNVTAIFPSITFASWASIFTGKMPKDTGILGNEFFARDVLSSNQTVTGMYMLPSGMVTLDADGGAFRPLVAQGPYSWLDVSRSLPFILNYVMPAEFSGFNHGTVNAKMNYSAPNSALQNAAQPMWDDINKLVKDKYSISPNPDTKCGNSKYECRTVSMFNQYARNADWWGTPSSISGELFTFITSIFNSAKTMDKSAALEATEFIKGYFIANSGLNEAGKRKRFPAVFSVCLSGLDHEAHINGLGGYKNYFTDSIDEQVKSIVATLKAYDEFDNKVFIIVSDHGETQMPTDLTYLHEVPTIDESTGETYITQFARQAEMSCGLKTNFAVNKDNESEGKNAKNAELANNSLHIWELGTMFQQLDPAEGWKLLVSKEIEQAIIAGLKLGEIAAVTSDINQANVIAALNGPMAHIYIKGADGWDESNDDAVMLSRVADKFNLYFAENGVVLSEFEKEPFPRLLASIDKLLIRVAGNYKIFKSVTADTDGNITGLTTPGLLTELETNLGVIKAAARIKGMNHPDRSGDIVLLMKDDPGDALENRYSTAYACKSWHGSLNNSDSYVPFIVAYPGGNKLEFNGMLTNVCPNNTCEGNWVLSDLIKKIVETQYSSQ